MRATPTRPAGHEEVLVDGRVSGDGPWRIALGALAVVIVLVLAAVNRHLTFLADDWSFLAGRVGISADTYLQPHNEHLSAVPVLIYQVLRGIFGTTNYLPYQLVALAAHLAVCGLVWLLCARRVGPWVALAPAAVVGLLGPATEDLLWAFQMGYFLAMASGLAAWALLERGGTRRDLGACVLLVLSLASASAGVGLVAGSVVLLLLHPTRWRRLWVVIVPTALYLLWYLGYGAPAPSADWSRVPGYMAGSLSAALASLAGLAQPPPDTTTPSLVDTTYGRPLAVVCVLGLGWLHARNGRLPALACAALGAALTLWFFIALEVLGVFRSPESTRYQYFGAVLLLVAAAALAPGWRPTPPARVLGVLALAWVLVSNTLMLHDGSVEAEAQAVVTRADLAALDIARPVVEPAHISVDFFVLPMTAGSYFSLADAHGTVAYSEPQLAAAPEAARLRADLVLVDAERLAARASGRVAVTGCVPVGGVLTTGPGTYVVRSPGAAPTLRGARFADVARPAISAPAGTSLLTLPRDASARPWRLALAGPAGATICRRAGA